MRSLRFIGLLVKLRLMNMMLFRLSFFGAFFADASLFVMQLAAFQAIYGQVDSIGGWGRGQMLIFIGTFSLINSLSMLTFFFGIVEIPGKIREGMLDHYLTKPGSALLRLSFESVDPGSLALVAFSAVVIAYGVRAAGIALTGPLLAGYGLLVLMMTLLWYDMMVLLRTLSFFFVVVSDTDPVERLEGHLLTLNFKVPGVVYKGGFKVLFYFVLPYGMMATVPTQALSGMLTLTGGLQALGVVAGFTWLTGWFWRAGLRGYRSASS